MRPPGRARALALMEVLALATCASESPAPAEVAPGDPFAAVRHRMVAEQVEARGVRDPRVLEALRRVPRHEFVPTAQLSAAHADRALEIAHGQHISQPYAVAVMTELAQIGPWSRVLEIGTGSGYQAAVLAEVAGEVYSIEIIEPLAREAERRLQRLGYTGIYLRRGDGYRGWPEAAPFDAILVTAAAPRVPEPLLEQLAPGGRLVIPVGEGRQELQLHVRTARGFEVHHLAPADFVPMVGEVREDPPRREP